MTQISKIFLKSLDGKEVPAFKLGSNSEDAFLLIHGYSSSKGEFVELAYDLAEKGYDCFCIDLRGHGENENPLDEHVLNDVEGAISYLRKKYRRIYAVGHSLGGLLALKSSADFVFAISPPLMKKVVDVAKFMLLLNSCKVREVERGVLFKILERLNPPERSENAVIFYGKNESEPFIRTIKEWAEGREVEVVEVESMQAEMPEIDVDCEMLKRYLPRFISHTAIAKAKEIKEKIKF